MIPFTWTAIQWSPCQDLSRTLRLSMQASCLFLMCSDTYKPTLGLYPTSPDEFNQMRDAMDKLLLTDASVSSQMERRCIVSFSSSWLTARDSPALGIGFRCGFLGGLHMEVFVERLLHEHGVEVIVTQPTVPYQGSWR